MDKRLENALDECLSRLSEGEDLEICLRRFPRLREELEPMLRVAVALRRRASFAAPPAAALARARARVMADAGARRVARPQPAPSRWWAQLSRTTFARAAATLALTVVLLGALLAGGSLVSANSLPGDPLYPIKRTSERVRLLLTYNDQAREELTRHYASLRVAEIKQVTDQGRETRVDFAGEIESIQGNTVTVEGIPIQIGTDQPLAEQLHIGDHVEVVAHTQDDGSVELHSLAISTPPPSPTPARAAPGNSTPTPPAQQKPSPTLAAEQPATKLTAAATQTPALAASATSQPTRTPAATRTAFPSATAQPVATQSPTVATPPREIGVRIEGLIQEITGDYWLVNGQRVMLSSSTRVNQPGATTEVGGWAIVDALQMSDGSLIAREIIVSHSPADTPLLQEFSGVIDRIEADEWTVAGRQISLLTGTVIEGAPQVGAVAHVKARQFAEGRLVAELIRVISQSEQVTQFAGPIQEVKPGRWVIAGQVVLVGPHTQIEGSPAVGATAIVRAVVLSDGARLAIHISVQPPTAAPATAQPTATPPPTTAPTSAPTAEPLPQPTSVPTAEPDPTEAPTATPTPNLSPSPTPIVETTAFAPTPEI